jgi:dTDP-4-amino-4,6-dideoxygalactose transaminase
VLEQLAHYWRRGGSLGSATAGTGAVAALEQRLAELLDVPFALAVSSGTAALESALRALRVGPGDEVITSAYDWGAATAAVRAVGATPVFADIDLVTGLIDPRSAGEAVGTHTRAIIATHLFGIPADMASLRDIADRHGLALIEDAAQALGAEIDNHRVGSLGDAACFSFGLGKVVDAGGGGALVTQHADVFEAAVRAGQHPTRQLREGVAEPTPLSQNHAIHPLAATLALLGIEELQQRLRARRASVRALERRLTDPEIPHLLRPRPRRGIRPSWHVYTAVLPVEGPLRRILLESLAHRGIDVVSEPVRVPLPLRLGARVEEARSRWPMATRRCGGGLLLRPGAPR